MIAKDSNEIEKEKLTIEDKPLEIKIELDDEIANEFLKWLKKTMLENETCRRTTI